ncbi:MAG: alpha/beta fold hydrolase [Chitinophagaceae bacterium]|nr:alpha/beta fold hydrolase [Chitinophagaceae bacterium]
MKKLAVLFALILMHFSGHAQNPAPYVGTWAGVLNVGVELRIVFHFESPDGKTLKGRGDSPDQGAFGFPLDTVFIENEKLNLQLKGVNASFAGTLVNDTTMEGIFTQGADIPLTLKKTSQPVKKMERPQTPKAPFPYKAVDVRYQNADKSISFGATITIPDGQGPFPAVVMITGSGVQNRDEEILGHKPFAVIADYLTRRGIIVLRVDDRGIGTTTRGDSTVTSADFAKDVSAGVDYLLTRTEVNKKRIGLVGHSEGGMIAPMVATSRKDISFIVLLAGPGVKIAELMKAQSKAVVQTTGISEKAVTAFGNYYEAIIGLVISGEKDLHGACQKVIQHWVATTDPEIVKEIGLTDKIDQDKTANLIADEFNKPWFRYFLQFDPQPYLQKLKCKVLALNGDKDIQVIASQNIPGIEAALKKSKSPAYETHILPGLNHLFQHCKACDVKEYGSLEETFSEDVLKMMVEWILSN